MSSCKGIVVKAKRSGKDMNVIKIKIDEARFVYTKETNAKLKINMDRTFEVYRDECRKEFAGEDAKEAKESQEEDAGGKRTQRYLDRLVLV